MIRADNRVIVATPHIIHTRFKLNDILDVRFTFNCPVHAADNATERKSSLGGAAGQLLEHL